MRAGEIRLALLGAQVRQLKQALGDDVYDIAAGDAQRLGGNLDTAFIEKVQHVVKSLVLLAYEISRRYAHVLEDHLGGGHHADAHLFAHVAGGKAFAVGLHQDQAGARRPGFRIRLAHDDDQIRVLSVGDERLLTVEDVVVTDELEDLEARREPPARDDELIPLGGADGASRRRSRLKCPSRTPKDSARPRRRSAWSVAGQCQSP